MVDRYGLFQWVAISALVGVGGILLLLGSSEPAGIIVAYLLVGGAVSHAVAATNMLAAMGSTPDERATALAATGLVGKPVLVVLPLVLGVVLDQFGVVGFCIVAASIGAMTVAGIWFLRLPRLEAYG